MGTSMTKEEALEQPEQDEPVACIGTNGELMWLKKPTVVYSKPQPLYTFPPKHEPCPYVVSTREGTHHCSLSQREPLMGEEIDYLWRNATRKPGLTFHMVRRFARAIEAAHGIGEKK
jgi:hypothetical protein